MLKKLYPELLTRDGLNGICRYLVYINNIERGHEDPFSETGVSDTALVLMDNISEVWPHQHPLHPEMLYDFHLIRSHVLPPIVNRWIVKDIVEYAQAVSLPAEHVRLIEAVKEWVRTPDSLTYAMVRDIGNQVYPYLRTRQDNYNPSDIAGYVYKAVVPTVHRWDVTAEAPIQCALQVISRASPLIGSQDRYQEQHFAERRYLLLAKLADILPEPIF